MLSYLRKNPGAGDTFEGIARFWTARQRMDDLQIAISELVAEGILTEQILRAQDGSSTQRYYRLDPTRLEEIEAMLRREQ